MKDGRCHCDPMFIGKGCEYHAGCPYFCNYQGLCLPKRLDDTTPWAWSGGGRCHCHKPFSGARCEIALRNAAGRGMGLAAQAAVLATLAAWATLGQG